MRFRERPTWPFLVAVEDVATDQVSPAKPRIDRPRTASADLPPASPALKRLAAGLGACADAQAQLVRRPDAAPAKRGLLGSFESDVRDRARRLFRVADPAGAGTCDERRFTTLAESCGLGRADGAAALAACGGGPFINEDAFVAALAPHIGAAAESRYHK